MRLFRIVADLPSTPQDVRDEMLQNLAEAGPALQELEDAVEEWRQVVNEE